jgi:hypothetical protein
MNAFVEAESGIADTLTDNQVSMHMLTTCYEHYYTSTWRQRPDSE